MSESKLTMDDIQEMVEVAASLQPRMKPQRCKCGKHRVYWVFASPGRSFDEVTNILSQDEQHAAFMRHISECGLEESQGETMGVPVEVRE